MATPQRRLVAYPIAADSRPVLPRRHRFASRILCWAYQVFFWLVFVVLATWWSHRPRPLAMDNTPSRAPAHYLTITP